MRNSIYSTAGIQSTDVSHATTIAAIVVVLLNIAVWMVEHMAYVGRT